MSWTYVVLLSDGRFTQIAADRADRFTDGSVLYQGVNGAGLLLVRDGVIHAVPPVQDAPAYGVPDSENPEWTDEELRNARLFAGIFPGVFPDVAKSRREWPPRWVQEAWESAEAAGAVARTEGSVTGRPRAPRA